MFAVCSGMVQLSGRSRCSRLRLESVAREKASDVWPEGKLLLSRRSGRVREKACFRPRVAALVAPHAASSTAGCLSFAYIGFSGSFGSSRNMVAVQVPMVSNWSMRLKVSLASLAFCSEPKTGLCLAAQFETLWSKSSIAKMPTPAKGTKVFQLKNALCAARPRFCNSLSAVCRQVCVLPVDPAQPARKRATVIIKQVLSDLFMI